MSDGDFEREPMPNRLVLFALSTVQHQLTSLRPVEHSFPIYPHSDNSFIAGEDELIDGFDQAVDHGHLDVDQEIGKEDLFSFSSPSYTADCTLYTLSEAASLFEGDHLPMGSLVFGSEPLPYGNGSSARVTFFHDGGTRISIDQFTDSTDPSVFAAFAELLGGDNTVTEPRFDDDAAPHTYRTGSGTVEGFLQHWPDILDALQNMP